MPAMSIEEARTALAELADGIEPRGQVKLSFEPPPEASDPPRIAHLVIDHPEARSAMTPSMMVDLADAVIALARWPGMLVILSSTDPRAFCSGGHLGQVTRAVADGISAARMAAAMTTVLDSLLDLPQLTVSAIRGLAIGGGAELVTATDFRVAGPHARIHFVHAQLGIAPGWGGAGRLTQIVGRRAALRILARARPLGPGEAFEIGLVDRRCDGPAVDEAREWLAAALCAPPEAVRALKRQIVSAAPARTVDPADEIDAFAAVWGGPAHRLALEALDRHRR